MKQKKKNNGLPKEYDPAKSGNVIKAYHTATKPNFFGFTGGFRFSDNFSSARDSKSQHPANKT